MYKCCVCGLEVPAAYSGDKPYPSSNYWNVERDEVYCGPEHMLQRHEEVESDVQR